MSEELEDIVIIEDSDAATASNEQTNQETEEKPAKNKKKIIIISAIGLVVVLTALLLFLFNNSSDETTEIISTKKIETKLKEKKVQKIEPSQLESMIAKANYLYQNGSKDDALLLYEKIAIYSEAISQYNLGVAQLKNKQYKLALQTFKKAIKNDEKKCVSAINAAVCSLYLNDKKSFEHYINLAYVYLPDETSSVLYSYYFTLINYYKQNYIAALSSLKHKTSNEYPEVQKHLSAKLNALFENNYKAIEELENNFTEDDHFNIALLYSRVGDFTLAINHFNEALLKAQHPLRAQLAMGLIKLKAGRVADGASDIQAVTKKYKEKAYIYYPIRVKLKDSLFDAKKAQKVYIKNIANSNFTKYSLIFSFSPYKIFNAIKTLDTIKKANANIFIDDVKTAQEYLQNSISSSNVNKGIAKAIKEALEFHLVDANKRLKSLLKIQPKHPTLLYDLALTYAQLGDMNNAYKYFIRSYHLDPENYLSGIFALMSGELINKKVSKLKSIIKDALLEQEPTQKIQLYRTLLYIIDDDMLSASNWLDNTYKQRPLYTMLSYIISKKLHKIDIAKSSANKLVKILPNNILPHILYIDANFFMQKPTVYAKNAQTYLKKQKFHFQDLYYGSYITRFLYINQNLITGKLFYLREQLKNELAVTKKDKKNLLSSLALASLFDKAFEEAYVYYNDLIDNQKVRDAQTLFLGAVASIAANHHENAIALLELSKMKDKKFLESRYALGLLYLEAKNNKGATIQLSKITKNGFISRYFDFEIDTNKLKK